MRHIIWIDIGTHQAQEYRAIFGSNYWFIFKIAKRILKNIFAYLKIMNVSSTEINIISLIKNRNSIRKHKNAFKFVFVEPNPHIVSANSLYKNADIVSQVAIDKIGKTFTFSKLYFGHGEKKSQGSSLFLNKHNITTDKYQVVVSVNSDAYFSELKSQLDTEYESYVILLRLNCEGTEDSVVYSATREFGQSIKLVLGSIKDVGQIKGAETQLELESFMKNHALTYLNFSSDVATWFPASKKLLELCKS